MINKPLGLRLIPLVFILFFLYYYLIAPVILDSSQTIIDSLFSGSLFSIFAWIDIFFSVLVLFSVTYGFSKGKIWAQSIVIGYLVYSSFWALTCIFLFQWQIIEHYLYLVIYVLILCYLLFTDVTMYFRKKTHTPGLPYAIPEKYYQYQQYILHKRLIPDQKESREYYFFYPTFSLYGIPCLLPQGYTVGFNDKSQIPYLRKER